MLTILVLCGVPVWKALPMALAFYALAVLLIWGASQ